MGSGAAKHKATEEEKKRNKEIDAQLQKGKVEEASIMKLLLLGGPECGKSTVLKQMQIIHKNGFTTDAQIKYYRKLLHLNAVQAIQQLLKGCERTDISIGRLSKDVSVFHRGVLKQTDDTFSIGMEMAETINVIWRSPAIQQAYARRHEFLLLDSAKYVLNKVKEVCYRDYVPTDQDILRCRVATTGMSVTEFEYKKSLLKMVDVGGQKSERRKWLHCFDDVKVVMFIVDLAGYCKHTDDEDEEIENNLKNSLQIFTEVTANEILSKASILLFLNKMDVFTEMLNRTPLSKHFPDFTGSDDTDSACTYIKELFLSVAPPKRRILPYFTTATNTENIQMVFQACMDSVLSAAKATSGL